MQNLRILIIDSGIGGLSVTGNILQTAPNASFYYIADKQFFPYGTLDEETVINRTTHLVRFAQAQFRPNIAVIACNTASTLVLDHLRAQFDIPFVGVVPAIKPAAKLSQNSHIAVLATSATVNRPYTQKLIADFAAHCHVSLIATPGLVEGAEQKLMGFQVEPKHLDQAVSGVSTLANFPDTVVLACTHFPLLKNELATELPQVKYWVDSGAAIARRVQQLAAEISPSEASTNKKNNHFCITGHQDHNYSAQEISRYLGDFELEIIDI